MYQPYIYDQVGNKGKNGRKIVTYVCTTCTMCYLIHVGPQLMVVQFIKKGF